MDVRLQECVVKISDSMKLLIKCFVLCLCVPFFAKAQSLSEPRWAVVDVSVCNLRLKPSYESSNETQALMGTVVQVLDADRYWRKVSTPDPYVAWVNDMALTYMDTKQKDEYIASPKWICISEQEYVYSQPDTDSERVCDICLGDLLRKGETMKRDWLEVVLPSGKKGWVRATSLEDFEKWNASRVLDGQALVSAAMKFRGAPYVWGGISPRGFDCSGLVKFAYMQCGVLLPRNAREQVFCGQMVPAKVEAMMPGDLLFYGSKAQSGNPARITHVAMYIGDGKIIHSSQRVRVCSLDPEGEDPYTREIIAVRRIIGHVDTGEGVVSISESPWYFSLDASER